ncbi:unnamed protein product [Peniophora sp. CBMAI 1063]|nr:unnamed protein product [Peniophora sp. CBMAI 1063]
MTAADIEKQNAIAEEVSGEEPSSSGSSLKGESVDEKGSIDEKETAVAELKSYPVPNKNGTKVSRYLQHNFFSTYRKIFTVVFFANIAVLIALIAKNKGTPSAPDVGSAASANLMVTILFRQENFVNLVYEVLCACPHSAPLWIRVRLAKAFHYGGFHSGAGVAAVFWYILYTGLTTVDMIHHKTSPSIVNTVLSYIICLMFCFIIFSAHPVFRRTFHDYFEATHRYSGWFALTCFWTHTIFAGIEYSKLEPNPPSLGKYIVTSSNFWTFAVSTCATLLSWGRLRRREVYPVRLSSHVTRLYFKYKKMPPFYGLKVSDKPLLEWHAFATIPEEDGFSVLVSNAGDWTSKVINNPPKKLWVRGYPLHGLLYTSVLFKQIVVVATGSGIGPPLSLFRANWTPRRIFWSTKDPINTFGQGVMDTVKEADPNAVIWDTRTQGRPDMVAITWQLVKECNAEAVFIISNPKLTQRVVYGMQTRGVAAYGAIFDS